MSQTKSIWIVTYHFATVKAGPVIRFMRYVPLFRKRDYELKFITRQSDGNPGYRTGENEIVSYHIPCESLAELTHKSMKFISELPSPPSYLLFFSIHYKNFWDLRKISKSGIKCMYVSTMHLSIELNQNTGKKRSWFRKYVLSFVLQKLYSLMDVIVSSTDELKQDFVDLGISGEKLITIYNGVDTEKYTPATNQEKEHWREALGLPVKEFIFLYVGLFLARKGVDDLLQTFTELYTKNCKFKLLMVGHEKDVSENTEEFNVNWPILKGKAIEEGWLITHPFSEGIYKYYKAIDAFVFMSHLEGMPNVILEAMACGLPLLTTKFKGFSDDYGIEREQYIVLGRNYSNDANTLLQLMNNDILRQELSERARDKATRYFDVNNSIDKYCQIFSSNSI